MHPKGGNTLWARLLTEGETGIHDRKRASKYHVCSRTEIGKEFGTIHPNDSNVKASMSTSEARIEICGSNDGR